MIDPSSIESLAASLPAIPDRISWILTARTRLPDAISPAVASLAQRGFLGCFPFAHHQGDELVLRVQPGVALDRSRVAIAWWNHHEGSSIATDLQHFVADRLAQLDVANPATSLDPDQTMALVDLAGEFGDPSSARRVLDAVPSARSIAGVRERTATLFRSADPEDPLCQILSVAWITTGDELARWVDEAIRRFGDEAIVQRLWVSTHVNRRTETDLTSVARQIVCSDDVFDPNYTGEVQGATYGVYKRSAMVKAIRWLTQHGAALNPALAMVWSAAQALAADPLGYDGRAHLAAARALAGERPALAYTLACNAAMYEVRGTERTPVEAIRFAHELAETQRWTDLVTLLAWSRREMDL